MYVDLKRQDTRFAFGFCHFPEVWPWGSYITSLNLSFLSCRKITSSVQSCCVKERAGKSRPSVAENRSLLFYFPFFFHLPLHFSVSQFTISLYICLFVRFLVQRWITESTGLQKFPTLFCMCACTVFQGENTQPLPHSQSWTRSHQSMHAAALFQQNSELIKEIT